VRLVSVNVGRIVDGTAIGKRPAEGPVAVGLEGLAGDEIGSPRHHGGPDQAAYAYGTPDYAWWAAELGARLPPGTFGENLTIDGLESATCSIGDRLTIGTAIFEVTAPRIPCRTLAHRMGDEDGFIRRFRDARRPGIYLRVLHEGAVTTGDPVAFTPAGPGALPLLELQDLFYRRKVPMAELERALDAPIAARARRDLERRLARFRRELHPTRTAPRKRAS
jgi:MOSC domain-containing protein YiiM